MKKPAFLPFLLLQPANALPAFLPLSWPWSPTLDNSSLPSRPQPPPDIPRHGQPADGFDFPHRPGVPSTGFVAFGDSYSAGIGTGVNGSEVDCRLGSHAYPVLIRNDMMSGQHSDKYGNATTFQHLSCTGSTIQDVLAGGEHSQVDLFNTTASADFALLSIGGNDLGFFDIMNSCIFRFYSFYSGTCEAALERSEVQIAGPEFDQHLRLLIMEILDRVQWEKRPWFTITVTGYARFFNADTPECDDYSLGMWWRGPKLKQDLRSKMNRMVLNVNHRIQQAIDTINEAFTEPRVLFVNYDDAFEGHRFCEPGVVEPDYMRNETWFFLVGGEDNDGSTMPHEPLPPNSTLGDPEILLRAGEVAAQNSMWYVPTYYGKTFHPRTKGHMAIRDRVYQTWRETDILSIQAPTEEL
ncbi:esterase [Cordyceps fumosorosea ARSEF 2679]|uniref:Esterase n=1 Tax=Cordyceps fumosorosea (strain ARSEF 2679) TaxID=1081104 RepID=A0A167MJI4_CORFA|nr:esterase [Cordyceps fumosorosea ARSEF 2679]OAA54429.1 esterase [Cordyceps fumosorosea ARSEF 2679]